MQTVIHKKYGVGEVISKAIKENGTYITVRFAGGKEIVMAIPKSFITGVVEATGSLKEEVEQAIIAEKEREEKIALEREKLKSTTVTTTVKTVKMATRKPTSKVKAKGVIQTDFEAYLEAAGYLVVGVSGKNSTVPQYARAVEQVLEREGITWADLKNDIESIVAKYDKGGECESFGARSNHTVISALKSFAEFVKSDAVVI